CPTSDNGSHNTGQAYHYYNGCYDSVHPSGSCTGSTCVCPNGSLNCSCSGSGSSKHCSWNTSTYTHTWYSNAHSTWTGCVEDRTQSYDVQNTTPTSTSTDFPAENPSPV